MPATSVVAPRVNNSARHEIYLYDSIGIFGDDAKSVVIDQIKAAGVKPIDLRINSPGGSVFDGYAIYNALRNHKPGVTVYIDGLAASIASYIAMAGYPIVMAANALIMVHNPSTDIGGGSSDDLRKQADLLDKITDSIVTAYSIRTGLPSAQIAAMLDEETWLDAETAKAFGFIDQISEALEMAASFDTKQLSQFKNAPPALKKLMNQPQDICCQPKEEDQPQNPQSPLPPSAPDPAPAPEPAPTNFFQRVTAIIKEKSSLAELNAKHTAAIEAKDQEITNFKTQITDLSQKAEALQSLVAGYQSSEKELQTALDSVTAENKAAENKAVDIVASLGFGKDELPAATEASDTKPAPKSAQQWLDEYNAIEDPTERTIFYRLNKTALMEANAELKKSEKK